MKILIAALLVSSFAQAEVCSLKVKAKDSDNTVIATDGILLNDDAGISKTFTFKALNIPYKVFINQEEGLYKLAALGVDSVSKSNIITKHGSRFKVVTSKTEVRSGLLSFGKKLHAEAVLKCPLDS